MRPGAALRLAAMNLRADPPGAAMNGLAACLGAAALVFFLALGSGVGQAARGLFPGEARLLEVVPSQVSLGGVLGGGQLDDEALARLAALPGAAAAWPKQNLRVPLAASRAPEGLAGNWPSGLTIMIPGVGVPRGLVEADLPPGATWADAGEGGPMPAVLSRRLVEIYNRAIAPSWNVRRLPPGPALLGLQIPVRVGFSIVPQKTEARVYEARLALAGLSDRTPVYAVALPLELVRRLNEEYGKGDAGYSAVALLAARPDDAPALAASVRRMGFAVDEGDRALAERVGTAVAVTSGALTLLALLMCALAGLAIAQSLLASVRARVRDFALLEAVGAAPGDVRALLLLEGGLTGLAGGVAGTVLARAAAVGADAFLLRVLPELPFRPATLVAWPWWLWLAGPAVAALAAVLGALAPAAAAARVDPARVLS